MRKEDIKVEILSDGYLRSIKKEIIGGKLYS